MSERPEITAALSAALEKKINPYNDPRIYWAKEVTFDYSTNHAARVDYYAVQAGKQQRFRYRKRGFLLL